jgi:hypothetical protein
LSFRPQGEILMKLKWSTDPETEIQSVIQLFDYEKQEI